MKQIDDRFFLPLFRDCRRYIKNVDTWEVTSIWLRHARCATLFRKRLEDEYRLSGVVPYLTQDAIGSTLDYMASIQNSEVVSVASGRGKTILQTSSLATYVPLPPTARSIVALVCSDTSALDDEMRPMETSKTGRRQQFTTVIVTSDERGYR